MTTSDKQTRKLSEGRKPFRKEPWTQVQNLNLDDLQNTNHIPLGRTRYYEKEMLGLRV